MFNQSYALRNCVHGGVERRGAGEPEGARVAAGSSTEAQPPLANTRSPQIRPRRTTNKIPSCPMSRLQEGRMEFREINYKGGKCQGREVGFGMGRRRRLTNR